MLTHTLLSACSANTLWHHPWPCIRPWFAPLLPDPADRLRIGWLVGLGCHAARPCPTFYPDFLRLCRCLHRRPLDERTTCVLGATALLASTCWPPSLCVRWPRGRRPLCTMAARPLIASCHHPSCPIHPHVEHCTAVAVGPPPRQPTACGRVCVWTWCQLGAVGVWFFDVAWSCALGVWAGWVA